MLVFYLFIPHFPFDMQFACEAQEQDKPRANEKAAAESLGSWVGTGASPSTGTTKGKLLCLYLNEELANMHISMSITW